MAISEYQRKWLDNAMTIIEQASGPKYAGAGIYQIFLNNSLVYIGQSQNMLHRIASHMYEIEHNKKSNKYIQLRRAKQHGCKIRFDVITHCKDDELDQLEGQYIRQYLPPLNYQIPKESGHGFTVNKLAKTITYERILKGE